jgi:hypothetical protein
MDLIKCYKKRSLWIVILFISILVSCDPVKSQKEKAQDSLKEAVKVDSFSRAKYGESSEEHVKKMVDSSIAKAMLDTAGLSKAPVKILSAKIVKQEYSSYRNVYLSFKNVSNKKIIGIKFSWYGTNAFNEPADLGNITAQGFGGGFTDNPLRAGKTDNGTWNVLSRDAKKIKIAWPTEVSFEDGTSWKINR